MPVIELTGTSMVDIEEALVRIWTLLERHHLASPRLFVHHSTSLSLGLIFESQRDANAVDAAVRRLLFVSSSERDGRGAPSRR